MRDHPHRADGSPRSPGARLLEGESLRLRGRYGSRGPSPGRTYYDEIKQLCEGKTSEYIERVAYGVARDSVARAFPASTLFGLGLVALGLDLRWTTNTASIVFSPVPAFTPSRLILRARAVAAPVDVDVSIGDVPTGSIRINVGLAEVVVPLTSEASGALEGPEPVRLWFHAPTTVPKDAGKGDDTRALGIGVDRVSLE